MSARRPIRTACAVLAVGASLTAALVACSSDGGEPTSTSGTIQPSSSGSQPADADSPAAGGTVPTAEIGACVDLMALLASGAGPSGGITELPTVDCSTEHHAQVVGLVDLEDGAYPGDEAVVELAASECAAPFEDFVGTAPTESALEYDGIGPSQESWDAGDRQLICLAFLPDVSTTTESFENSGR